MKNYLKKYLPKQEMTIDSTNDSILFNIKKILPFFQTNLIIKHRKTGKRVSKKMKNKKVELFRDEIVNLFELANIVEIDNVVKDSDENEVFDIFLKYKLLSFEHVKRVMSPVVDENITLLSEKSKSIFKAYTTAESNLSFSLIKSLFNQEIKYIKNVDSCLLLNGNLELFDTLKFDELEICAQNTKTFEKRYFKCVYTKNERIINFRARINFKIGVNDINSIWKLSIRIKNNDLILDESFLDGDILNKKASYEKMLLITGTLCTNESDESLEVVLYLYLFKNYLRLGVNTKKKWLKLFNNAKINRLYEKYCKKEILDKRKIFFESFRGKSYSNSPKYVYEKMLELGYDKYYKFVWSYEGSLTIPGEPMIVNSSNKIYYKELASSKYWVTNYTFPVLKNKKNVYLQLWQGTPLKRLGHDINVNDPKISWNHLNKEYKGWDFLVSANKYSSKIFEGAFKFKKKILEVGYPANDIFYSKDKNLKKNLKKKLNLNKDKKIILYAPTFRDDNFDKFGERCFNLELNLERLRKRIVNEYILLIRLHPVISKSLNINNSLKNFVFDFSNYDDVHELFLISDILITDYSSVFFDYAHSKNPILFFMPDLKDYNDNIRGLYLDIKKDLPGPIFLNEDELIDGVENISRIKKDYKDRYNKFYNTYCDLGQGNASEKVIKNVFEG